MPSSTNATSLVFKVYSQGKTILFCGDIEFDQLRYLDKFYKILKSDILIFPHHGSKNGLYPPFMNKVSPRLTIFSCGWNNSFNHPANSVIQYMDLNNLNFHRTDFHGGLTIEE